MRSRAGRARTRSRAARTDERSAAGQGGHQGGGRDVRLQAQASRPGMGIAFSDYHGTLLAGVAEVSVDRGTGEIEGARLLGCGRSGPRHSAGPRPWSAESAVDLRAVRGAGGGTHREGRGDRSSRISTTIQCADERSPGNPHPDRDQRQPTDRHGRDRRRRGAVPAIANALFQLTASGSRNLPMSPEREPCQEGAGLVAPATKKTPGRFSRPGALCSSTALQRCLRCGGRGGVGALRRVQGHGDHRGAAEQHVDADQQSEHPGRRARQAAGMMAAKMRSSCTNQHHPHGRKALFYFLCAQTCKNKALEIKAKCRRSPSSPGIANPQDNSGGNAAHQKQRQRRAMSEHGLQQYQ